MALFSNIKKPAEWDRIILTENCIHFGERDTRGKVSNSPKKTETDYNMNDAHFVWHIQGHCYYSSDTLRQSQQNSVDAVHITESTELSVNSEDKWVSLFSYLITF